MHDQIRYILGVGIEVLAIGAGAFKVLGWIFHALTWFLDMTNDIGVVLLMLLIAVIFLAMIISPYRSDEEVEE